MSSGSSDIDAWLDTLFQCKPLSEEEIKQLCEKVKLIN